MRASASTRLAFILIAPASAATFGLAEWAWAGLDPSLTQAQAAMTLLGILALYWTVGAGGGPRVRECCRASARPPGCGGVPRAGRGGDRRNRP